MQWMVKDIDEYMGWGGMMLLFVRKKKKTNNVKEKKRKKKSNLKRDMWQKTLKSTMRYIHIKMILYSVRRERRYRNDRGTS